MGSTKALIAVILGLVSVSAVAADAVSPVEHPVAEAPQEYKVGPRDILQVEVFGEDDLTRKVVVTPSSMLKLPFIEEIYVGGMTTAEVEEALVVAFADGVLNNPQVAVEVLEHLSKSVEVYGVTKPGTYFLSQKTTLLEILAKAGWVDAKNSSRQVTVRRGGKQLLNVSFDSLMSTGEGNISLNQGDLIRVGEGQVIYVGGEVKKPGTVTWSAGLTVSAVILRAGGASDVAKLKGAYLIRNGERVSVNLSRIETGKDEDIAVEPEDRLYIPQSAF